MSVNLDFSVVYVPMVRCLLMVVDIQRTFRDVMVPHKRKPCPGKPHQNNLENRNRAKLSEFRNHQVPIHLKYLPSRFNMSILDTISAGCVIINPFHYICGPLIPASIQCKLVHYVILIDTLWCYANTDHR